jgi:DNA-binding transcriptional regulator YdaS (Cro superfamily)
MTIEELKGTAADLLDGEAVGALENTQEALRALGELPLVDLDGAPNVDLEDIPEKLQTALQAVESLQEAIHRWRLRLNEPAPASEPRNSGRTTMTTVQREEGLRLAIEAAGTRYRLAMLLGIRPASVLKWWRVPSDRIVQVEAVTGIPREKLRPDLYRVCRKPASVSAAASP